MTLINCLKQKDWNSLKQLCSRKVTGTSAPTATFIQPVSVGGAMKRGRCPECKAEIGGTSHTLAAGNLHAPEMDEAANMENFDIL